MARGESAKSTNDAYCQIDLDQIQFSSSMNVFINIVIKTKRNIYRRRPTFPPTQDRIWHVLCQDLQPGKPNAARSTSAAPTAAAALIKNHHLLSISAPTHHPPTHNVRLRPDPQRRSRARDSFRPPGPESALHEAARRFLRFCWPLCWRH
jgi:hypothetical protein